MMASNEVIAELLKSDSPISRSDSKEFGRVNRQGLLLLDTCIGGSFFDTIRARGERFLSTGLHYSFPYYDSNMLEVNEFKCMVLVAWDFDGESKSCPFYIEFNKRGDTDCKLELKFNNADGKRESVILLELRNEQLITYNTILKRTPFSKILTLSEELTN